MVLPIAIDLQAAQNPSHHGRGIARYSIELTSAMLDTGMPIEAIALSPHHPVATLPPRLADSPQLVSRSSPLFGALAARGPFAYHLMSPMELDLSPSRTLPASALERADAIVSVVYDFIPLLFPDRYLVSPRSRALYDARLALLPELDLLLAISEHTRRDAIELLGVAPDRVAVIGGAASEYFRTPAPDEDPREVLADLTPAIAPGYVLTVAAWEWRKNLETLVRAVARLPELTRHDTRLVVVCSGLPTGDRTWEEAARDAGLAPGQFTVIGPVTDRMLRALYQAARLFVYPSRYEGFGLPVIEAARCGAPVLTSSTSSLPEVLDLPESTFPPDDEAEMAAAIERALTDDDFRASLVAAGARASERHTWDAVATRVRTAYARLDRTVPASLPRPARLAVVCASSDRIEIARALASSTDLAPTIFTIDSTAARGDGMVSSYPVAALDDHLDPCDYDAFVAVGDDARVDHAMTRLRGEHDRMVWCTVRDPSSAIVETARGAVREAVTRVARPSTQSD